LTDIIRAMPDGIAKLIVLLSLSCAFSMAEPIKPHPANSHYFLYQGKPAILITSAEHYDAVINKEFNSERFKYDGGNRKMNTPIYAVDVALRIKRIN
jgi:hypothetical protein